MVKYLKMYATYTFSTSPNLHHRVRMTLINTDASNCHCHISLEFIKLRLLRYESAIP